jgi:hypothetical protein
MHRAGIHSDDEGAAIELPRPGFDRSTFDYGQRGTDLFAALIGLVWAAERDNFPTAFLERFGYAYPTVVPPEFSRPGRYGNEGHALIGLIGFMPDEMFGAWPLHSAKIQVRKQNFSKSQV